MRKLFVIATMILVSPVMLFTGSSAAHADPKYVALGDSVAAGYGLPAGSQSGAQDRLCKRSSRSYPERVARRNGYDLGLIACSGATVRDGLITDQEINGARDPKRQLKRAFTGRVPRAISITIGANDMGWSQLIALCYATRCGRDIPYVPDDTDLFETRLALLEVKLVALRAEIWRQSALRGVRPPRTVLTGYYNPFGSARCQATRGVTSRERRWIGNRLQDVNALLRRHARQAGWLSYAPVDQAFRGHRLCSPQPYVTGPRTIGRLHPTAAGQRAYARAVLNRL